MAAEVDGGGDRRAGDVHRAGARSAAASGSRGMRVGPALLSRRIGSEVGPPTVKLPRRCSWDPILEWGALGCSDLAGKEPAGVLPG